MAGMQYTGNVRSPAEWAGDFGGREHILPTPARLDPTQFVNKLGIAVTLTQDASESDTTITVSALALSSNAASTAISAGNVVIPNGATLDFGGAKFARTTSDAILGDTTIVVAALPTAMSTGDKAVYNVYSNIKYVPSGTYIGRTFAERNAGTGFGPAAASDDEQFLMYNDVVDANINPDCELYRHQSVVKENYLPDYTALSAAGVEVQTLAVDTILSGGKIGLTAVDTSGVPQAVLVAYNTSWTQTVADIQTALNAKLGTSAVAVAVTNTHDATFTFSGTGYTGVAQPLLGVDISAATGPTKATVTRTTAGGTPLLSLIRSKYRCVKGVD